MGEAEHYFEAEPSPRSQRSLLRLDLPDLSLDLVVDRGVFAARQIDPGTKYLLLDAPPPPEAGTFVDLGCGYGPIASTLARRAPGATVWAVDVNSRARQLCAENAARAGATNVRVVAPDEVPADLEIDLLWSNPPIRIGKAALHDLLSGWLERLAPDGRAVFVVQKHLGSDSLQRWLAEQGWSVASRFRAGYRLLQVQRDEGAQRRARGVRAPARRPAWVGGAAPGKP